MSPASRWGQLICVTSIASAPSAQSPLLAPLLPSDHAVSEGQGRGEALEVDLWLIISGLKKNQNKPKQPKNETEKKGDPQGKGLCLHLQSRDCPAKELTPLGCLRCQGTGKGGSADRLYGSSTTRGIILLGFGPLRAPVAAQQVLAGATHRSRPCTWVQTLSGPRRGSASPVASSAPLQLPCRFDPWSGP